MKILPLTNPMSLSSSIADFWFRQAADLSGPRWVFPWDPSGLVDPSKMKYMKCPPNETRFFNMVFIWLSMVFIWFSYGLVWFLYGLVLDLQYSFCEGIKQPASFF